MFAVSENHIEMVKLFMEDTRVDLNIQDYGGQTALHKAVSYDRRDVLQLLLSDDRVITTLTDTDNKTPLKYAIDRKRFECVRILEEHAKILKYYSTKVLELPRLDHQCTLRF